MSIGTSIRRIRQANGISQAELARRCKVTDSMICQIERGTKVPTLPLSIEIAEALGCEVNDLITDKSAAGTEVIS